MTVRKYKESDLEKIGSLINQTIDVCYTPFYTPEAIKYYKDYHSLENILQDAIQGDTIVLEIKGLIVGTSTLLGSTVKRMFIAPDFQHHHFGTALMEKIEQIAIRKKAETIDLCSTHTAIGFYKKLGYELQEELIVELDTQKLVYHNMKKKLLLC